jgi:ribosomal protein L16 Arg81 hydroxylase
LSFQELEDEEAKALELAKKKPLPQEDEAERQLKAQQVRFQKEKGRELAGGNWRESEEQREMEDKWTDRD